MTRDVTNDASNTDLSTNTATIRLMVIDDSTNPDSLKEITAGLFLKTAKIYDTSNNHTYALAVSELTADRTVTLPLLTSNDVFVFADFVQTLTNKRITRRKTSETSSATPTINTDNADCHQITALAAAVTSFTTNLSGTPTDGQELDIEVLDNGTARALTFGASFASGPATLPTTTTLSKWLYVKLRWSSSRSKWICMATGSEV